MKDEGGNESADRYVPFILHPAVHLKSMIASRRRSRRQNRSPRLQTGDRKFPIPVSPRQRATEIVQIVTRADLSPANAGSWGMGNLQSPV